ncbi:MAG: type I phosphomannose isomerase catalytic subunit [Terriglobales bacterium]
MPDLYPLLLLPEFKERVWGARDLAPLYPNYKVEGEPIGEVWLTGDDCRVANGRLTGQTLGVLAHRYGRELVGEAAPQDERFPLLIKFLFPREKLSVQVHPTDEDARRAGLPCGKSECWYVVVAEIDAQVGLGLKAGTLRVDFEAALRRGERADQLLNWIYVRPGEIIYNPAGTVHCIGPGSVLLETQQNSDTTYRLYDYGRSREMHLEQGLAAMKERSGAGKVARGSDKSLLALSPFFRVEKFLAQGESVQVHQNTRPSSAWAVVALDGCGVFAAAGVETSLARGEALVVPAAISEFTVRPQWRVEYLCIAVPPPGAPHPPTVAT